MRPFAYALVMLLASHVEGEELALERPSPSVLLLTIDTEGATFYSIERTTTLDQSDSWDNFADIIGDGTPQTVPLPPVVGTEIQFFRAVRLFDDTTFTLAPGEKSPNPDTAFPNFIELAFNGSAPGQFIISGVEPPTTEAATIAGVDLERTFSDLSNAQVWSLPTVGPTAARVGTRVAKQDEKNTATANADRPLRAPGSVVYRDGELVSEDGDIFIDGNEVSIGGREDDAFDFGQEFGLEPTLADAIRDALANPPGSPSDSDIFMACAEGALSVGNFRIIASTFSRTEQLADGSGFTEFYDLLFSIGVEYNCETMQRQRKIYLSYTCRVQFFGEGGMVIGEFSDRASYLDTDSR